MDIVIVSEEPFSPTAYGQQAFQLASYLARSGHNVWYLPFSRFYFGIPLTVEGVRIQGLDPMLTHLGDDKLVQASRAFLKAVKPDCLISIGDLAFYSWLLDAKKELRVPIIATAIVDGYPLRATEKGLYNQVDCLIALTKWAKGLLEKEGYKAYYLPHCIDTSVFHPIKKEEKESLDYLFVGANVIRKNIASLVVAFSKVIKEAPNARLWLHCSKKSFYGHFLYDIIESLGLRDKVLFIPGAGVVTFSVSDMARIYNRADVHVSATSGEGFGLTHVESMACGLPQIYPDYSSLPEVIGEGGIAVPIANYIYDYHGVRRALVDIDKLAEAMLTLYNDKALRLELGWKAYHKAQEYSAEKVLPRWRETIEKAVEEGK